MIEQDMAVTNDVLRRIGEGAPDLIVVEMAGMIESSRDYFTDACHLTDKGGHPWGGVFLRQFRKSPLLASPKDQSQHSK